MVAATEAYPNFGDFCKTLFYDFGGFDASLHGSSIVERNGLCFEELSYVSSNRTAAEQPLAKKDCANGKPS